MVASIDQSFKNTAICIFENNGELLDFTVIQSKKEDNDSAYEKRIENIVDYLMEYLSNYDITDVALEGLAMNMNSTTARPLGGLYYHMLINFNKANLQYSIFSPKTVKKVAIHGNAKKEEMYEVLPDEIKERFIQRKYKKTTGLFDLTDAYFIGKAFFQNRS